jgi:hypothetical protein
MFILRVITPNEVYNLKVLVIGWLLSLFISLIILFGIAALYDKLKSYGIK